MLTHGWPRTVATGTPAPTPTDSGTYARVTCLLASFAHMRSGGPVFEEIEYTLAYTIDQFRLPLQSEFSAVAELTAAYLFDQLFLGDFASPDTVVSIETETTGNDFNFGLPPEISYRTTVQFSSEPTNSLAEVLVDVFLGTGEEDYLLLLRGLGISSIFSTTTTVDFLLIQSDTRSGEPPVSSESSAGLKKAVIGAAAAGGACIVALLAVFGIRSRIDEKRSGMLSLFALRSKLRDKQRSHPHVTSVAHVSFETSDQDSSNASLGSTDDEDHYQGTFVVDGT